MVFGNTFETGSGILTRFSIYLQARTFPSESRNLFIIDLEVLSSEHLYGDRSFQASSFAVVALLDVVSSRPSSRATIFFLGDPGRGGL